MKTGHHLRSDESGSVAIVFGLTMVVLLLFGAIAMDSARSYNVSTKVQTALDAAALAAAKLLDQDGTTDAEVEAVAAKFFEANVLNASMNGLAVSGFRAVIDRTNSTVKTQVDVALSSEYGHIAGLSPVLEASPSSIITFRSKKIELSLVLDITGSMDSSGKIDALRSAAKDLVDALADESPSAGQIRVALVPYSASVNAGALDGAVAGASTGDTCVVERSGGNAYTDFAPDALNKLGRSSTADNARYSCPTAEVMPLTDLADPSARDAIKTKIDAMMPNGGTAGHIGAAWGWYMLSPDWASEFPAANRPRPAANNVLKAVILMTDGEFNTSYQADGLNATDPTAPATSSYQALQLCDNMKNAGGLTVYSIAFLAPAPAETMMRTCSGDENYYDAASNAQLVDAFRDIVKRLTSLRIAS